MTPDQSKSYGTGYTTPAESRMRTMLCSADTAKSVLPIMYWKPMATRAQLHVEHDRVARGSDVGEDARLALLLGAALLGDRSEIRSQRELERICRVEQPAASARRGRVGRRLPVHGLGLEAGASAGAETGCRQGGKRSPPPPTVPHPVAAHPASLQAYIFPSRGEFA